MWCAADGWIRLNETDCRLQKLCGGANKQKSLTFTQSSRFITPLYWGWACVSLCSDFLWLAWTLLTQTSQGLATQSLFQVAKFHKGLIISNNLGVTEWTELKVQPCRWPATNVFIYCFSRLRQAQQTLLAMRSTSPPCSLPQLCGAYCVPHAAVMD